MATTSALELLDPGRLRQIACESHIRSDERFAEIARHAPRDGDWIGRPVARRSLGVLIHPRVNRFAGAGVGDPQPPILSRDGDDADPALDGAEQASSARVVRVLPEKLHATRHPERDVVGRVRLRLAGSQRGERRARVVEQACLGLGGVLAQTDRAERRGASRQRRTATFWSRAVTFATSARRERSSTGASAAIISNRSPSTSTAY